MILVDPRRGSGELLEPLRRIVPCEMDDNLPGDFIFEGAVEGGTGLVGIERKKVSDSLDCMCTGRYSGYQLIEMSNVCQWMYLILEGMFRPNKDTGFLELWAWDRERGKSDWRMARKGSRSFTYEEYDHHITTLSNLANVRFVRTYSPDETVRAIASRFTWHTKKAWDEHTSHLQLHQTAKPGDRISFRKPKLRRIVACDLPGIGFERSKVVAETFDTTEEMMNASVEAWDAIPGIGKVTATKVYNAIRSE